MFSAQMVRAILHDLKMETRRVVKPQPILGQPWKHGWTVDPDEMDIPTAYCPYGIPGDRLWVRERWRIASLPEDDEPVIGFEDGDEVLCGYPPDDGIQGWSERRYNEWLERQTTKLLGDCARAALQPLPDGGYRWTKDSNPCRWQSPLFMPVFAARTWLEITNVRVEQLQDITGEGCLAEGIREMMPSFNEQSPADHRIVGERYEPLLLWIFGILWDSINAKRGYPWDSNPWVWVVQFRVLGKP